MKEWLGVTDDFPMILFRLVVACVICGVIGYERDKKGENAGIRTHILVGVASCVMVITSIYYMIPLADEKGVQIDIARIPAYIISGVGFLGAGTIITNKVRVKGLTTAASIWMVAIIGIMIGFGMILHSILIMVIMLFVLHVLKKIDI